MKKILLVLVAMLVITTMAYAATRRLGSDAVTFNPTNVVAKTAAYTLTSTDSEVRVTCSSANIAITLPTIASLSPGTQTYKIVKSDSTAYAVIVTAGTGDTVGGEAQRYILAQNAYMIISKGANNDWHVAYESPYLAEDHSAGTSAAAVTGNTSITGTLAVSGATTLSGRTVGNSATFTMMTSSGMVNSGNSSVGGTLAVTGATTLSSSLGVASGQTTLGSATGAVHAKSVTFSNESGFLMTNNHGVRGRLFINASGVTWLPR